MSKQLFSLDIRNDLVAGVMLSQARNVRVVSACSMAIVGSRSTDQAVSEVVEQIGYSQEPCYVSFGAENFFFRNLQLPFSDRKKVSKMLLYELEESAPVSIRNLIVDYVASETSEDGAKIVAAMCERNFLAERLAFLKSVSIDPEKVGIGTLHTVMNMTLDKGSPDDFVYIDIGLQRATVIPVVARHIHFIRSLIFDPGVQAGFHYQQQEKNILVDRPEFIQNVLQNFGVALKQTLLTMSMVDVDYQSLPFLFSGPVAMMDESRHYFEETLGVKCLQYNILQQPLLKLDPTVRDEWVPGIMDHALAQAIIAPKEGNCINLRTGEFAKTDRTRNLRKGLAWSGLGVFLLLVVALSLLFIDVSLNKKKKQALDQEIMAVFTKTLPNVQRVVNPLQQLETRVQELKRSSFQGDKKSNRKSMMALLSELSSRIPSSLSIKISRLLIDKNGLLLKGTTNNYNSVDSMKKKLEESPFFKSVTINSSNLVPKSSDIRFELKVEISD